MVTGMFALVEDTHAVRSVFNQVDTVFLAESQHSVKVADLAAHVGDHEVLGAAILDLLLKIFDVEAETPLSFNVDTHSACVLDSGRNCGEGESIGQHLVARLDTCTFQREEKRRAAGVQRDAVLVPSVFRNFLLAEGHDGFLRGGNIVAVKFALLHQADRFLDTRLRDGIGLLDVLGDDGLPGGSTSILSVVHSE